MPARTGNSTYIPGVGTTTRGKSGKAKTFQGSGPAPSGTKKEPETTYLTAPTLTVQGGHVTASGFKSRRAQRRAVKRQQARSYVQRSQATRKRTSLASTKRLKQTERAVKVAKPIKSAPPSAARVNTAVGKAIAASGIPATQPGSLATYSKIQKRVEQRLGAKASTTAKRPQETPAKRQVRRQLAKAKAGARHLTGDLGPEQRRFIRGVSKRTRLNPRTIAAQARAEEGAGEQTEAEQSHNFLNMGPGIKYSSLKEGIRETAKNYNTNPLYAGVRATRGKGPKAQAQAIVASPWGTTDLIEKTLPEVGLKGKPIPRTLIARAKKLGINPQAPNVGRASKQVVTRYRAGLRAAKELARAHIPYVWGGGHGSPTSSPTSGGLDCSGAVSYVLNKMGVLKGSLVSGSMGSVLKPGPGAVTVFYNAGHTFMSFGGKFFGTSVNDSSKGLAFYKNPGADYLSQYSVGHVAGLGKKQALQLGLKSPDTQSFPGMSLSSSGTTATINSGAGATVSKPGFSAKPIRLTPAQKSRRTFKRLGQVGIGEPAEPQEASTSLKALERKYGVKA